MRPIAEWTDDELSKVLLDEYSLHPRCRICGSPLQLVSGGSGGMKYACDGREWAPDDAPEGTPAWTWREGRAPGDDHYAKSIVYGLHRSDPRVVEAVNRWFKKGTP